MALRVRSTPLPPLSEATQSCSLPVPSTAASSSSQPSQVPGDKVCPKTTASPQTAPGARHSGDPPQGHQHGTSPSSQVPAQRPQQDMRCLLPIPSSSRAAALHIPCRKCTPRRHLPQGRAAPPSTRLCQQAAAGRARAGHTPHSFHELSNPQLQPSPEEGSHGYLLPAPMPTASACCSRGSPAGYGAW